MNNSDTATVSYESRSDLQQLVESCQAGDVDAFTGLFVRYEHYVFDLAQTILQQESIAEDVVQDTFIAVYQKIGSFRAEASFKTWLTTIVVNQCRTRLRRQRIAQFMRIEQLSPRNLFEMSKREDDTSSIVHNRLQRNALWQAVDQLPTRLRLPLILRYRYALACDEIARVLKVRKSTVYSQLHEGRRALELSMQQAMRPHKDGGGRS